MGVTRRATVQQVWYSWAHVRALGATGPPPLRCRGKGGTPGVVGWISEETGPAIRAPGPDGGSCLEAHPPGRHLDGGCAAKLGRNLAMAKFLPNLSAYPPYMSQAYRRAHTGGRAARTWVPRQSPRTWPRRSTGCTRRGKGHVGPGLNMSASGPSLWKL